MANTSTFVPFLLALSCILSALARGARFYSLNEVPNSTLSAPGSGDIICRSLIERLGYPCEKHTVTSEDGYILGLQRIPTGRSGEKADKPPVLLQHGLFVDAATWVLLSPEESLAFILADNGYDVWLSNTRGTISSRGHKSLSPNDPDYWNWSWDEIAAHDLPALFQYVNNQTGQKLHYVGHSLGTLTAFSALSQGKLLDTLRSAALLAPVAFLSRIPSLLTRAIADLFLAEEIYWLGVREFIPKGQQLAKLLENVCNEPGIDCLNLVASLTGPNCCIDKSEVGPFLDHEPQSTATKNLIHLAQMIRDGTMAKFNYENVIDNMKHYGTPTPPSYDLSSIPTEVPLFISYGAKDFLADVADVQILLGKLKNHAGDKLVVQFVKEYAHGDFILGVDANKVVYSPIMDFFKLH